MKTHLSIPIKKKNGKILHITDTHLFADELGSLLGINTNASFQAVLNEIESYQDDFDLIVATGDFVQDGSEQAYVRFAEKIKQFDIPCVWLAGNHDIYTKMNKVFNQYDLPDNKVILLGDNWLIILLNSQVEGKAYGSLSDKELQFLTSTLAMYPNRYVSIFLHHHPVMSGCQWLDAHSLKNSEDLEEIIKVNPNIKTIGWGHIHQQMSLMWHHCYVFSTPSTCVQFEPECDNFKLADGSPGWRVIDVSADGSIETVVHCLEKNMFFPDKSLNGY